MPSKVCLTLDGFTIQLHLHAGRPTRSTHHLLRTVMSPTTIQFLRLFHIVLGAWWLGSIIFVTIFLFPAVRALGPAGGQVMGHMVTVQKLPVYMAAIPLITVLSGLTLYWNDSSGFTGPWMHSGPGRTFAVGAAFGLIVMTIGIVVSSPAGKRLSALGAAVRASGGPPSAEQQAEMQRLQDRLFGAARISAVLLVIAAGAMAIARYMPS